MMQRVKCKIAYNGTNFNGIQKQLCEANNISIVTIQTTIQKALNTIFSRPMDIDFCGRTDAGVHAIGQVIHFDVPQNTDLYRLKHGLNHFLVQSGICILDIEGVDAEFHSRFSAVLRTYRYCVLNTNISQVFTHKTVWMTSYKLDLATLYEASQLFVGTHDFYSFTGPEVSQEVSTVKTVNSINVFLTYGKGVEYGINLYPEMQSTVKLPQLPAQTQDNLLITIEISAKSFLHNMVRSIVGSVIDCGRNKLKMEDVSNALIYRNKNLRGQIAPACGLYFCEVKY